jgi:flagellar protein FliO/FliZ
MTRSRPHFAAAALLCAPVSALAVEEVPSALRFFNNALFLVVLVVLGLAIWWLRRRMQTGGVAGQTARVFQLAMLGTRERIALVEFEGRRLLVGVTPAQITLLCELDRDPKRFSMVQGAAPGGDGNASV